MSTELRADYNQIMLLPPSLEDWIPSDHMARYIREFVDSLDLNDLGFKQRKSEDGRPSYAPDLLLKVWLYGYLQRIRSSRKLEKACRNEIPLVWLTGMHYPDHNTLWRFWRDNQKAVKKVFHKTVRVALDAGLVGMVVHAVDGTKIQACSSTQTMWRKKSLAQLLNRVEGSVKAMEAEIERSERKESEEYHLPEELQEKKLLREKIEKSLAELEKEERSQMNPSEKDALVVKTNEGKRLGYNAQVVVDDKQKLIVAAEVTTEQNDSHQLNPMIEIVEPVMAWVKHLLGFKRWTVRRIDKVRSQWAFICASINLNKLYLLWRKGEFAWD
jgi:transposase